jgi:serine/threonine protein kinase
VTLDREQVEAALPAYEIGSELGRGGWGVVIEARHRQLGREVAIKQLPRAFGSDPGVRGRFIAEARVLASLDHPHIVPVHDYVEVDGLCLLVMEKLSGGTVWDRFAGDGLPMETTCAVILATCAGLHAAHKRGILHRDVKPENLMFSAGGVLKVTDFGIAKVVGGNQTMATRAGEVLGTPSYMAPEHAKGAELGPPADVYATAVTMYELLSGHLPFSDQGDALAVLYRHVTEQPTPLRDVAPDVPAPIADVVMHGLATAPEDRFESAEAFGVALADAAGAAWGTGWASERAGVAVMGSGPIVSAIERTTPERTEPVPPAVAPTLTASVPAVSQGEPPPSSPSSRAPAAPRAATTVFPGSAGLTRHALPQVPESPQVGTLHAIAPTGAPPDAPSGKKGRKRALLIGVPVAVVAVGAAAALLLGGGGGKSGSPPPTSANGVRTIFTDNFTNTASGWAGFTNANATVGYNNGAYQFLIRTSRYHAQADTQFEGRALRRDLIALGDVAVEADATKVAPAPAAYGLMCRRGAAGEYYVGLVYSTGQARIERIAEQGGHGGVLGQADLSTASTPGAKHLRLECSGATGGAMTIRLFVDGAPAVAASDTEALGPSPAGMFVYSPSTVPAEVTFDNFTVKTLPAAPGS